MIYCPINKTMSCGECGMYNVKMDCCSVAAIAENLANISRKLESIDNKMNLDRVLYTKEVPDDLFH